MSGRGRDSLHAGEGSAQRVEAARVALLARLTADPLGLAARVGSLIFSQVPDYAGLVGEARSAAVAGVEATTALLVRRLSEAGSAFSEVEEEALESFGARRAGDGLPADALRAALRTGFSCVWSELVQRTRELSRARGQSDLDELVVALGELGESLVALEREAVRAMLLGYSDQENQQRLELPGDQMAFLADLLAGAHDESGLGAGGGAVSYGLLLFAPLAALGAVGRLRLARADLSPRRLAALAEVRASPAPHLMVLLPVPEPKSWSRAKVAAIRVCAGHRLVGLCFEPVPEHQVHTVYELGESLIGLAGRTGDEPRLVDVEDLMVYRLLAAADQADPEGCRVLLGAVTERLSRLAPERRRIVEITVRAMYEAKGDRAAAAAALAISAHTLRWRMRELASWTGLALDSPGDQLKLELAVRWLRLKDARA
ncbi:MAG: helix-turn-helix domain-containing protein [Mycobacteriales bacterium]